MFTITFEAYEHTRWTRYTLTGVDEIEAACGDLMVRYRDGRTWFADVRHVTVRTEDGLPSVAIRPAAQELRQ